MLIHGLTQHDVYFQTCYTFHSLPSPSIESTFYHNFFFSFLFVSFSYGLLTLSNNNNEDTHFRENE